MKQLFSVAALLLFTSTAQAAMENGIEVTENVAYGPLALEELDICSMPGGAATKPGVLLIHGGAWYTGDKKAYDGWCRMMAAKGFVVAEVNYRLAQAGKPETWWPAQLADVQLAMRWMRAHAAQLNLDTNRLCALGDSAGGQLAVFLGVKDTPVADNALAGLFRGVSPKASCVVDNYGPVDFTTLPMTLGPLQVLDGGKSYAEAPALYRDASPLFLVDAHSAPMLVAHGYHDRIVATEQSLKLVQALRGAGVPVQFIGNQGDHNWDGLSEQEKNKITNEEALFLLSYAQGAQKSAR